MDTEKTQPNLRKSNKHAESIEVIEIDKLPEMTDDLEIFMQLSELIAQRINRRQGKPTFPNLAFNSKIPDLKNNK